MKRLLTMILVLLPATAFAQAGYIGIYSDPGFSDCTLLDQSAGYVDVYVVHKGTTGATGAQFKVVGGGGFSCIYIGEASPPDLLVVGDSQTGIGVAYGQCHSSDVLLLVITLIRYGGSATCSYLDVVPDPAYGTGAIAVTDCATPFASELTATGARLYVNPDATCSCAVAVETTTWGGIKGLYQ